MLSYIHNKKWKRGRKYEFKKVTRLLVHHSILRFNVTPLTLMILKLARDDSSQLCGANGHREDDVMRKKR